MGLLDYADLARKKLAGLLGEMPLVQMAQGRAEMPTRAGLLAKLKGMPVFSPDAGESAYEAAMQIGPMGLGKIVYHGSPHKFDKFDASKIGTGEGAQAYGHGVYLADAEDVAKGYQKTLAYKAFDLGQEAEKRGLKLSAGARGEFHRQAAANRDPMRAAVGLQNANISARELPQEKLAELFDAFQKDGTGALYKADLPDEWIPKMLDWDKPIGEQKDLIEALRKSESAGIGGQGLGWRGAPEGMWDRAIAAPSKTGEWLYREIANNDPKATAEAMRALGIPGIRYLDGGSRPKNVSDSRLMDLYQKHGGDANKAVDEFMRSVYETPKEKAAMRAHFLKQLEVPPSYNYVVFPGLEDQVKILERNGVPLSGLLGGK